MSSTWGPLLADASRRHGVFTRSEAAEFDLGHRALKRAERDGLIERRLSDVFVVAGAPSTWKQRLMVVSASGGTISHRAAAALHGLDGCRPGIVEASFERGSQRSLGRDVVVHRWRRTHSSDVTELESIQVTSVARTLAQLGMVVSPDRVEQALDSALRAGYPAPWIEQTMRRLMRPGPTGVGVLAEVIRDPRRAGALPDSWFERLVQRLLETPELPPPTLQHPVVLPTGRIRRLDLAWPVCKLGVEAHSRLHHWGPRAAASDEARDLALAAQGWQLIYLTWGTVMNPGDAVDLVVSTWRARQALASGS